jgi:hypothetical protein
MWFNINVLKIHFDIIPLSTRRSPKWSHLLGFSDTLSADAYKVYLNVLHVSHYYSGKSVVTSNQQ